MNIFVGHLSYEVSEEELASMFGKYGTVQSADIIRDYTGYPRGFGFVVMPNQEEAQRAIAALNGQVIRGRVLSVSEARHRDKLGSGREPRRRGPRW